MTDHQYDRPHEIRLSAAWEPPASGGGGWLRRFGRPAGIGPGVRVTLVVERGAAASVSLNGFSLPRPVPESSRWAWDVTGLLAGRNVLQIDPLPTGAEAIAVSLDRHGRAPLPDAIGCVRLEILTPTRIER
jgi:hypothetical protein